jgi:hypothetical protein
VSRQRMAWLSMGDRGRRVRTEDGEGGLDEARSSAGARGWRVRAEDGGGLRRHNHWCRPKDSDRGLVEARSLVQA